MNKKKSKLYEPSTTKQKSVSLSQQFVKIQKILSEYERNKFHPKIQNFHYMSSKDIRSNKSKQTILKRNKDNIFSQQLYGPLPQAFKNMNQQKNNFNILIQQKLNYQKQKQKSYDITQITFASSKDKESYIKFSKLKNQKRLLHKKFEKNNLKIKPNSRYNNESREEQNNKLLQLLGQQIECANSRQRSNDQSFNLTYNDLSFQDIKIRFSQDFANDKKRLTSSKSYLKRQNSYKKYAETNIQQFLQTDDTKLTMSQKRRITQFKQRDNSSLAEACSDKNMRRHTKIERKLKSNSKMNVQKRKIYYHKDMNNRESKGETSIKINSQHQPSSNHPFIKQFNRGKIKKQTPFILNNSKTTEQQTLKFSNKGWLVVQQQHQNEYNRRHQEGGILMTL